MIDEGWLKTEHFTVYRIPFTHSSSKVSIAKQCTNDFPFGNNTRMKQEILEIFQKEYTL